MHLFIHDLEEKKESLLKQLKQENIVMISNTNTIKHCIGCFGCWIKTPAQCIIKDGYENMGELISKSETLTIISRCFYGGFSPFIKNVLDRSISYLHPYFAIRNGEMHHKRRYDNHFKLTVYFYGEDITQKEKETAEKLVKANAVNFDCDIKRIFFVHDIEEMGQLL